MTKNERQGKDKHVNKTLYWKLKTEEHKPKQKLGMIYFTSERQWYPAPLQAPVVFLVEDGNSITILIRWGHNQVIKQFNKYTNVSRYLLHLLIWHSSENTWFAYIYTYMDSFVYIYIFMHNSVYACNQCTKDHLQLVFCTSIQFATATIRTISI